MCQCCNAPVSSHPASIIEGEGIFDHLQKLEIANAAPMHLPLACARVTRLRSSRTG
jgi:hypothetical protein